MMTDVLPRFGLGTYRLKNGQCYEIVKQALVDGYQHVDTAQLYKNEDRVGQAIADSGISRRGIFVTTKVDPYNIRDKRIIESLKDSFLKLQLDYVDLVLLHAPMDDVVEEWRELVLYQSANRETIRSIGVSNYKIEHLRKIIDAGLPKPVCNQIEVTPFLPRTKLVKYCHDNGIQVVAHSSLTKGEKLEDVTLLEVSADSEMTCAQTLLKWGLQQKMCVIPRTSKMTHLKENLATLLKPVISTPNLEKLQQLDVVEFATHPKYL